MDFELVFIDEDDSTFAIEDDAETVEIDEVEDDCAGAEVFEDAPLSQAERATLLNEMAPSIASMRECIGSFESKLVTAFKLTGSDFSEWQNSPYGLTLESLFSLHDLMHQLEHAILHDSEIGIGIARRRLQQRSEAVFNRAEELIEQSMLGKAA